MELFHFPEDLVALQVAWLDTYAALAGAGRTPLRRRLIMLSCRLHAHPYWTTPGDSRGTWAELRRQAGARRWATAA
ncbi:MULTISPECIES: hypothetical protein [unclassified Streptomyces]|uniref:hypothetical protein n=1 Tax=unclassified Streptomyces TaxID=2593676 RepID=UPI0004BE0944|nr:MULTISPECIES: hypothetical protein [unclassified Streptomyces]